MFKNIELIFPGFSKFRAAIQADLTHVPSFRQEAIEKREFPFSLACELRVKAECRANALRALGERRRTPPCRRRCGYGQDIHPAPLAFADDLRIVRVEIEMAMKVDQLTP